MARELATQRHRRRQLHRPGRRLHARAARDHALDLGRRPTRASRPATGRCSTTSTRLASARGRAAGGRPVQRARDGLRAARDTAPAGLLARVSPPAAVRRCSSCTSRCIERRRLRRRTDRRVFGRGAGAPLRARRGLAAPHDRGRRRAAGQLAATVTALPGQASRRAPIVSDAPLAPALNGLVLRGQGWRTSIGLIGNTLFWMVRGAVGADRLDAARHLAPHAPARADPGRAGAGDELPAGDGKLDAHGHARHGPRRTNHLRQRRVLPDDRASARRELVGRLPPYPYWPPDRIDENSRLLQQELQGRSPSGGHRGEGHAQGRARCSTPACTFRR